MVEVIEVGQLTGQLVDLKQVREQIWLPRLLLCRSWTSAFPGIALFVHWNT
jgi:hypothetical protein